MAHQIEAGTLVRYARQIMALDEEMTEHERRREQLSDEIKGKRTKQ